MSRPAIALAILAATLVGPSPPAGATTPVPANTGSVRVAFATREWVDVGLAVQGVSVDRLRLHPPGRVRALFTRHDEANRGAIVVTNATDRNVTPAVAIAIFDEEGRLLAAANTGNRMRAVPPGKTLEMDVHFGGVFRHVDHGAYIYVSLEY